MQLEQLIEIARGDRPADLVLRNARVVNVFTGDVETNDVAIAGGVIAGLGQDYRGTHELDLGERYLAPGFMDAHIHLVLRSAKRK